MKLFDRLCVIIVAIGEAIGTFRAVAEQYGNDYSRYARERREREMFRKVVRSQAVFFQAGEDIDAGQVVAIDKDGKAVRASTRVD